MNSNEFLNSVFLRARQMCFPLFYHAGSFSGRCVLLLFCVLGAFWSVFAAAGAGVTGRVCLEAGGAASFSPDV